MWQDARQTLGEHALARSRRTDEQQVVPTRRRYLKRLAGKRMAGNVGQVWNISPVIDLWHWWMIGPGVDAFQTIDNLTKRRCASHCLGSC